MGNIWGSCSIGAGNRSAMTTSGQSFCPGFGRASGMVSSIQLQELAVA